MSARLSVVLCIVGALLVAFATYAYADKEQRSFTLKVGEQMSLPAEHVEKYSEGTKGVIDVRLPDDAQEFVIVGLRPGNSNLLFFMDDGSKVSYRFEVKAQSSAVPKRENIRLDFYFVEVSESGALQAGLAWPSSIGVDVGLELALDSSGLTAGSASLSGLPLPRLDVLHRNAWAKIARQASVIAANGEQANFDSGGEVNVAIQGSQAAELRQIPFGTKLRILPRYDRESGRLEVTVDAEVSSLGEGEVPSRTRSSVSTVVNVGMNEAIVLAGLSAKAAGKSRQGLPFLSQIPVLGTLFGSHGRREEKVQNVIFIVPSIVDVVSLNARSQIEDALSLYERFDGDVGSAVLLK